MTNNQPSDRNELVFIRKLCPDLNEEKLRAAEDRFREYVDLVIKIHMRVLEEEAKENTVEGNYTSD